MPFNPVAQARSTLIRLGGLALLLLLLNGLIGLGAIRYSNETYLQDIDALDAISQAQDLTQTALIDFKKQVQEWKNILLRGNAPDDLAKYRAAFEQEYAAVQTDLERLQAVTARAGLADLNLGQIIDEHAALKRAYDAALAPFIAAQGATPRITDAEVRGQDRALTERLDAIGASAQAQAVALRQAISQAAEARYRNIVLYTFIANAVIAALVVMILVTSLRAKRAS